MEQFRNIPLGAKPDRQDRRDVYKCDRYSFAPVELPRSYTLPFLPPIKDQGKTSSCTGHAISWFWEQVLVSRGVPYIRFSPMYTWYYARKLEGVENKDEGVQMRSIMSALNKYGATPEEQWPFGVDIRMEPSISAQALAAVKLPVYERCDTLYSIKYSLTVEKQSVCIGVPVRECWYSPTVSTTGNIPYQPNQPVLGGHAIVVCGYDDDRQTLLMANSWGTQYGNKGFFRLPYLYLELDWWDAWTAGFDTIPDSQ